MLRLCSLILLICMMVPFASAQETPSLLTERYVAPAEAFSFKYPAEWELDTALGNFSVPIQSTQTPQNGTIIDSGFLTVMFSGIPQKNTDAASIALEQAQELSSFGTINDPIEYTLNTKEVAQVDVITDLFNFTYLVMTLDQENYLSFILSGTADQILNVLPMAFEVLGSARLRSDLSPDVALDITRVLPETYHSTAQNIRFQYPAGWQIEEMDTYTLIIAPDGSSVGISQIEAAPSVPGEYDNAAAYEIALSLESIQQQVPNLTVIEPKTLELDGGSLVYASVIESTGAQQMLVGAVELGNGYLGRISLIGTPAQVQAMEITALSILRSLQSVSGT